MKLITLTLTILFGFSNVTLAADHSHDSPHGGLVEDFGGKYHLEMRVYDTGNISFYLLSGELKPIEASNIKARVYFQYSDRRLGLNLLPADEDEAKNDEYQTERALKKSERNYQFVVARIRGLGNTTYDVLFDNPQEKVTSISTSNENDSYYLGSKKRKMPKSVHNLFLTAQSEEFYKHRDPLLWLSPLAPGIAHIRMGKMAAGTTLMVAGASGMGLLANGLSQKDDGLIASGAIIWGVSALMDIIGVSSKSKKE